MRRALRILLIQLAAALSLLGTASCHHFVDPTSPEQTVFYDCSSCGLFENGAMMMKYDPEKHQQSINPMRHQYRFQNDTQNEIFCVVWDGDLSLLNIVTCQIYTSVSLIESRTEIDLVLVKYDSDHLWLWDPETKKGVIIPAGY